MMEIESEAALDVQNITKVFSTSAGVVEALRRVSFSVERGQFVSIVGPLGSGKTTPLNMIGALDRQGLY
jgi:putative ABC transport system ATP-binding protein